MVNVSTISIIKTPYFVIVNPVGQVISVRDLHVIHGGQCVSVDVGYASKQKMKSVCICPNVKVINVKININKLVY